MLKRSDVCCVLLLIGMMQVAEAQGLDRSDDLHGMFRVVQVIDIDSQIWSVAMSPSGNVFAVETQVDRYSPVENLILEASDGNKRYVQAGCLESDNGGSVSVPSDTDLFWCQTVATKINWRTGKSAAVVVDKTKPGDSHRQFFLPTWGLLLTPSRDGRQFILGDHVYNTGTGAVLHQLARPTVDVVEEMFTDSGRRILFTSWKSLFAVENSPGARHQPVLQREDAERLYPEATCEVADTDYIALSVIKARPQMRSARSIEIREIPSKGVQSALVKAFRFEEVEHSCLNAPDAVVSIGGGTLPRQFLFVGKDRLALIDPTQTDLSGFKSTTLKAFGVDESMAGHESFAASSLDGRRLVTAHMPSEDSPCGTVVVWEFGESE